MRQDAGLLEKQAEAQSLYEKAAHLMETGAMMIKPSWKQESLLCAASLFDEAGDYKDGAALAEQCRRMAREAEQDELVKRCESVGRRLQDSSFHEYDRLIDELEEISQTVDEKTAANYSSELREEVQALQERCLRRKKEWKRTRMVRRGIMLCIIAVCAAAVTWSVGSGYINYLKGIIYQKAGMESYALASFRKLGDRFGADIRYTECELESLRQTEEGSTVTFGAFKWKVTEKNSKEDTVTLIASEISASGPLAGVMFHSGKGRREQPAEKEQEEMQTDWASSSLREWLNGELFFEAFSSAERERILEYERDGSVNEMYGTAYEDSTMDYLAPPSAQEMEEYAETAGTEGDCWLRSPGNDLTTAAFITSAGVVRYYGMPVDTMLTVRPVIRVRLG